MTNITRYGPWVIGVGLLVGVISYWSAETRRGAGPEAIAPPMQQSFVTVQEHARLDKARLEASVARAEQTLVFQRESLDKLKTQLSELRRREQQVAELLNNDSPEQQMFERKAREVELVINHYEQLVGTIQSEIVRLKQELV